MASGAKIGLGVFGCRADAISIVETYSSFNGTTPTNFLRFAFLCENRTPGFFDTGDQLGFEITAVESAFNGTFLTRGAVHLTDNNDDPTNPTRRSFQRTFSGVALINDNDSGTTQWYVRSSTAGGLNAYRNGGSMPNTCTYGTLNIDWGDAGGFQGFGNFYLVDSVGQTVTHIGRTSADLIACHAIYGGAPVNSESFTQNRIMWGFFKPSTRKGFTFSTGYFNGAGVTNLLAMSRNKMLNTRINPDGFRLQFELGSVSAAGTLTWEVTSTFNTIASTTNIVGIVTRFQDLGVSIGLVPLTMDATNTVNSFQTNSVSPEGLLTMTSLVKSLDTNQASNDPNQGSYSFGFWEYSQNKFAHSTVFNRFQTGSTATQNTVGSAWLNYVADNAAPGQAYAIGSVTTGSNGWAGVVNTASAAGHTGSFIGFVAFGEKVNAPLHLMDASSSSIFLADDSDYDDNLLLLGAVASPLSTRVKYGSVGKFNVDATDSNSTAEIYGAQVSSETPKVRLWVSGPPSTAVESNQGVHTHGFGFNVMSGDGVLKYSGYAQRKDGVDDDTRVDHDGDTVDEGPVWMLAATNTEWSNVVSVGPGIVYTQEGDVATDGYPYNAMILTGSVQSQIINTQTMDHGASSGTTYTFSWDFVPDFVIGMHYYTNIGNEYNGQIYNGITFFDNKFQRHQTLFNQQNNNVNKITQFQSRSVAMPLIVGDSAYYDSGFDVISWGQNLTLEVRSPFGSPFGDPFLPGLLAIKQGSEHGHQIANVALGAAGTKSIQTNSISPYAAILYTTDTSTLDAWTAVADVRSAEGFSINFWTKSLGAGWSMSHALMGDDTDEHTRASSLATLLGIYGNVDSIGYSIGNISAGSGGFSFVHTVVDTGKFGDVRLGFVAMGPSVVAPGHLATAAGESIFLADDSDYSDNLLTTGLDAGSVEPGSVDPGSVAAGGALFRKFPDTDDREFPLPLTSVRAFPSD